MRLLFLHDNFPGQYRRIAGHLSGVPGVDLVAGTLASNRQTFDLRRIDYQPRWPATPGYPALATAERAAITAQAAYQALDALRGEGWTPDLVCAHSGWGPSLLLRELWPGTRILSLYEWYYHAHGSDADFLEPMSHEETVRTRFRNLPILADLADMDWGTSPTRWQWSQFPGPLRNRISVLHEGVDCEFFSPGETGVTLDGTPLTAEDEIVTYVARGMEPYRGFPQFMEAVALLLERRPRLRVLVVGSDRTVYGRQRTDGRTHGQHALETLDLDPGRVHFLGVVPLSTLRSLFRVTRAHVYLTVPFVLSWSMLEAMASGALVIGSDTPPVREVIRHGENGLLTDFFDPARIAADIETVLTGEVDAARLKRAARETVLADYALPQILARQWALMRAVARQGHPD